MQNNRHLIFYTDGSYSSKSEYAGWAAVCLENDEIIDTQYGCEPLSTNNRGELLALLSAMENVDTIQTGHTVVTIYTDSAYIANCFKDGWYRNWLKNGWRTADKQSVKNQDLWSRIIALYIKNSSHLKIEILKIKGHSGNKWNEYVDLLAKKERNKWEKQKEEGNN